MKKLLLFIAVFAFLFCAQHAVAQTYHQLSSGSFTQNWSNTGLISANTDWSGVSSIIGYRGDTVTTLTNVNPQTIIDPSFSTVLNVTANQTTPNTITSGGIAEFEIADPVVAFQGSGTADAPNLVVYLNTTSCNNINVTFKVRDIDGSADNSIQQFALQYRVGSTGNYVNIPSAYIADATEGPSLATLVTNVDVILPVICNNETKIELRFMTSNAGGSDEWIGIDDISITTSTSSTPSITVTSPVTGAEWAQGSIHNITWTATGTNTNVKIEYTGNASDATPTWVPINEAETTPASAGTFAAQVPVDLPVSADSKIRITDIPETASGLSDIFSITAAQAPVTTFNPINAATGIDIASNIILTFDVPVRNIDDSEITDANVASLLTLTTTDALGTPVPFTATIDVAKKVITINPDADLSNEQLYYFAIAPVEGLGDNATIAQSITFTTASSLASSISDITISETAPYHAGDLITINWVSKNVTDVLIEAWIPSQSKWETLFASTPSDGTETFTIPLDAQYSTDYKIRVTDVANAAVTAESGIFTIQAALSAINIVGNTPYYAGDTVAIIWTSANITNVKIEVWFALQGIWVEIFPSTPSDGMEGFIIPSFSPYSTEYKIRISDVANPTISAESNAFTVIAVAPDLVTLRAQPLNSIVKYSGIATVTYARTAFNQKYIQDATAAILIHDPTTAPGFISGTYNIGDGITNIVGKISLFNKLIELVPTQQTGEPATGIEIVPEVRTLVSLTDADQSKLVKIENFAFLTPTQYDVDGKFVAPKSYDIDGVDKAVMVYRTAFAESDYIGGYVPVGPISSVVLVGQFNTLMQITARSWSDMVIPTVAEFDATPTFVIEGESVQFQDISTNNPISWEWTFSGGTPATSTEQNPLIQYNADGLYSVTLKATNASGGNNTVTKTDFITVGGVGIPTLASDVSVYPNPTKGKLFIANPAKEIQEIVVFNSLGKHFYSFVSAEGIIPLNITVQTKGMYIIRITNNVTKSVRFKKIILN